MYNTNKKQKRYIRSPHEKVFHKFFPKKLLKLKEKVQNFRNNVNIRKFF